MIIEMRKNQSFLEHVSCGGHYRLLANFLGNYEEKILINMKKNKDLKVEKIIFKREQIIYSILKGKKNFFDFFFLSFVVNKFKNVTKMILGRKRRKNEYIKV